MGFDLVVLTLAGVLGVLGVVIVLIWAIEVCMAVYWFWCQWRTSRAWARHHGSDGGEV